MNMKKLVKNSLKASIVILCMSVIVLMVIKSDVYSSSFKFGVTASKTKLKPGESTIVTMKISDIVDSNNLGINALESILEYDTNVLEVVTPNDMAGKNNWTITYNTVEQNFLLSNIISGVKEEQEIGEIKFKVKDNVGQTKTIIRFKNVKSNDGNNLMTETDKEIELTIYEDEAEEKNELIKVNGNTSTTGKIEYKNDTASVPIPKAGESTKIILIISMIGIIGIFSYMRYKNVDK